MDIQKTLAEAIINNIQREPEFYLSERVGVGDLVVFNVEDRTYVSPKYSGSWELSVDAETQVVVLRLYLNDGTLWTHLTLSSKGVFSGRDRINRGTLPLCPKFPNHWGDYAKPIKFLQTVKVPTTKGSFRYKDVLAPAKDFSFIENWDADFSDISTDYPAIVILAYNRPHYFEKVVHSIAQNPQAREWPVFVFLDYDENDPATAKIQVQQAFRVFPHENLTVVQRPSNAGCGRHLIDARRQIFDNAGFSRAYFFEDDLVVSPHYITKVDSLWHWAENNYSNVGAVQGWNYCAWNADKKQKHLDEVKITRSNLWGYCLSKTCWDAIKPAIYEYEKLFLFCEYTRRPHNSIREWFKQALAGGHKPLGESPLVLTTAEEEMFRKYFDDVPTGQDGATQVFTHAAGYVRLCTVVNRGEYIGKQGLHMNPRMFASHGLDKIEHTVYNEDVQQDSFSLVRTVE